MNPIGQAFPVINMHLVVTSITSINSYFRMCLEKSKHKLLVRCSNPREFFFIRVFKGVLSSEFVDY